MIENGRLRTTARANDGSLAQCPSSCNITAEVPLAANIATPVRIGSITSNWSPVRVCLIHKVPVIAV